MDLYNFLHPHNKTEYDLFKEMNDPEEWIKQKNIILEKEKNEYMQKIKAENSIHGFLTIGTPEYKRFKDLELKYLQDLNARRSKIKSTAERYLKRKEEEEIEKKRKDEQRIAEEIRHKKYLEEKELIDHRTKGTPLSRFVVSEELKRIPINRVDIVGWRQAANLVINFCNHRLPTDEETEITKIATDVSFKVWTSNFHEKVIDQKSFDRIITQNKPLFSFNPHQRLISLRKNVLFLIVYSLILEKGGSKLKIDSVAVYWIKHLLHYRDFKDFLPCKLLTKEYRQISSEKMVFIMHFLLELRLIITNTLGIIPINWLDRSYQAFMSLFTETSYEAKNIDMRGFKSFSRTELDLVAFVILFNFSTTEEEVPYIVESILNQCFQNFDFPMEIIHQVSREFQSLG